MWEQPPKKQHLIFARNGRTLLLCFESVFGGLFELPYDEYEAHNCKPGECSAFYWAKD